MERDRGSEAFRVAHEMAPEDAEAIDAIIAAAERDELTTDQASRILGMLHDKALAGARECSCLGFEHIDPCPEV